MICFIRNSQQNAILAEMIHFPPNVSGDIYSSLWSVQMYTSLFVSVIKSNVALPVETDQNLIHVSMSMFAPDHFRQSIVYVLDPFNFKRFVLI